MTTFTVFEDGVAPVTLDVIPRVTDLVLDQGRGPQGPSGAGDLTALTTEAKSSIVAAINELNMDGVSFTAQYNNAKAG